ncbi:MAG: hypothetical protein K0S79_120 [Nitrospira sp.]|jgi:hypothetical protein|nr:hypothetical protein [Nitrospira sp.]
MITKNNKRRIKKAKVALAEYIAQDPMSESCCLTDLLTDLRHWAEHEDVNFADCLRLSEEHFQEERNGQS